MCHLCWIYSCAFLCALIFLVLFVFYHFIDVIFYLIFYSVHLFSYFAAKMSNKFFCSVCSETLSQRSLSWRNMVNAYKLLIIMQCIKLTNKVLTCKTCEFRCFFTLAPFCSLSGDKLILRVKRFNEKFSATNNTFCKITESSRVHVMFV